jgi:circadian clock protein KaiB
VKKEHPKPAKKRAAQRNRGNSRPTAYLLKLYIAGMSPRSVSAIRSIKGICTRHLANNYALEIIDLYRNPKRAKEQQIIAAPTLIKELPVPLRRLIGSLTDESKVVSALDVKEK